MGIISALFHLIHGCFVRAGEGELASSVNVDVGIMTIRDDAEVGKTARAAASFLCRGTFRLYASTQKPRRDAPGSVRRGHGAAGHP